MAEAVAPVFLIPSPNWARSRTSSGDPERVTQHWIGSRERCSRRSARPPRRARGSPSDDGHHGGAQLHPAVRASFCPALQELNSIGVVVKWPANASSSARRRACGRSHRGAARLLQVPHDEQLRRGRNRRSDQRRARVDRVHAARRLRAHQEHPNNHGGAKKGSPSPKDGRTDQAAIPMQVHAFLSPNAPKRIEIKRGEPMAAHAVPPREFEIHVMNDADSVASARSTRRSTRRRSRTRPGATRRCSSRIRIRPRSIGDAGARAGHSSCKEGGLDVSETPARFYLVPSTTLGASKTSSRAAHSSAGDWIAHGREILKKKRQARRADSGSRRIPSERTAMFAAFGAESCPRWRRSTAQAGCSSGRYRGAAQAAPKAGK